MALKNINVLKYALISDIGIYDLIYYDESKHESLVNFCKSNGISYLPCKNRKNIYKYDNVNGTFEKQGIKEEYKVNPYDLLFSTDTIDKFLNCDENEVRFIVEDDTIKGVVHLIDYNNEFLRVELFRALFRFETGIRKLLIINGYTNGDFIEWVKERIKEKEDFWHVRYLELMPENKSGREKIEERRKSLNPFQSFYFKEIMQYAKNIEILDIEGKHVESINNLRNSLAHGHAVITHIQIDDNVIYNHEKLKLFVESVEVFIKEYEKLSNLF